MSNNDYGNLGNEMKAMKDGRASLMVETKDNRDRIRAQTERFVSETGKAREKLAAQTRQMLSQAQRKLNARTRQTLAEADELVGAIRKDVAGLKAEAGRIITGASGFLAQTRSDNAKLRGQTHKMLAHAHAETKAQARKVMAQTRTAVAGLKTETGRVLAEATGVMQSLCTSSRQRAAGWRDVLRTVRGHGRGAPAGMSVAVAVTQRAAKTKPKGKKKASAKKS
jgi:ElaB/YqjD/DUF883 family membrane-anchored ribosome-binding protein